MTQQNHSGIGDNINVNGNLIYESIKEYPSIIAEVVNELGKTIFLNDIPETFIEFDIEEKIRYNNVIKYKSIIEEHKIFQGKLNVIYDEIESSGSNKKQLLLRNVRNHYLKTKGDYIAQNPLLSDIDNIRENADAIINKVENELLEEIIRSNNINAPRETINIALSIILVDAFMRCEILEEPLI